MTVCNSTSNENSNNTYTNDCSGNGKSGNNSRSNNSSPSSHNGSRKRVIIVEMVVLAQQIRKAGGFFVRLRGHLGSE